MSEDALRRTEIFGRLAESDLRALILCLQGVRYDAGEVAFREGDPGATMMIVADGSFLATTRRNGIEERLNRMRPGEVMGEMAFLDPAPRSATVTAEIVSTAYVLSSDAILVLRTRAPAVVDAVVTAAIRDVTRRLRRLDERIEQAVSTIAYESGPIQPISRSRT